jgi:uncharacterized protein involved in exopolysaccharide biosynthesis
MNETVVDVAYDKKTSMVDIDVYIPKSRFLAAEVANYLAEQVGYYNRFVRTTQAKEQLTFIEKRMDDISGELSLSETRLKEFREKNRDISGSPGLQLEQSRLMRTVEIDQAVYIELKKNYEIVKLEVVKTTPVINILQQAYPPFKKYKPSRLLMLIIALFVTVSLLIAYFYILSQKFFLQSTATHWLDKNELVWIKSLLTRLRFL